MRSGSELTLNSSGGSYERRGRVATGSSAHRHHLELSVSIGDRRGEAHATGNVGVVISARDGLQAALPCWERDLEITREIADRGAEAIATCNLGTSHRALGHYRRARDYLERGFALCEETGDRMVAAVSLVNLGGLVSLLGDGTLVRGRPGAAPRDRLPKRHCDYVDPIGASAGRLGLPGR